MSQAATSPRVTTGASVTVSLPFLLFWDWIFFFPLCTSILRSPSVFLLFFLLFCYSFILSFTRTQPDPGDTGNHGDATRRRRRRRRTRGEEEHFFSSLLFLRPPFNPLLLSDSFFFYVVFSIQYSFLGPTSRRSHHTPPLSTPLHSTPTLQIANSPTRYVQCETTG